MIDEREIKYYCSIVYSESPDELVSIMSDGVGEGCSCTAVGEGSSLVSDGVWFTAVDEGSTRCLRHSSCSLNPVPGAS